jgi:DNA-binding IclR family transcriptional regulator
MNPTGARTVNAVTITCEILTTLRQTQGAGVTEIAERIDRSKGTVHSHLATLEDNQFVVNDGEEYRLSFEFLNLAEHVKDQVPIYDSVESEIDSLASETGEVASFGVEERGQVVYVYKTESETAVETASTIGYREHMHSTALGKAILAHLPEERVHEIVDAHGLPQKTEFTITDREDLIDALETVRERGYAIDDEENVRGLRCLSAPVTSPDGVVGAVSVSGPSRRIEGEALTDTLPDLVRRSANILEVNSKFS